MTNMPPLGQRQHSDTRTTDQVEITAFKTFPNCQTQASRLLAALLGGQRVNPLAGWRQLGIYRLADTAFQLRKLGWPVVTGALEVPNRFGEKCRVAEYRLDPEAIDAAGQEAQDFAQRERELREVA
jgi:hypothetical protein